MNQGIYASDTITYSGKVYYDKNSEGIIKIETNNNSALELEIAKSGNLRLPCGTIIGRFDTKNHFAIDYSSSSCPGGGLGGGTSTSITGTRK
jgi:hypothetical protein